MTTMKRKRKNTKHDARQKLANKCKTMNQKWATISLIRKSDCCFKAARPQMSVISKQQDYEQEMRRRR
ncbi:unnamed protein product [Brugia pahangi]|uniref:Conserved domain protein n=1 Tax=Brugia pahangi TaxID=6280 RepID=A0A0N4T1S8_BRUPA|nr:unnamed protein product [Brugia pahangi]